MCKTLVHYISPLPQPISLSLDKLISLMSLYIATAKQAATDITESCKSKRVEKTDLAAQERQCRSNERVCG